MSEAGSGIRRRLPRILAEIASVIFAVLVALTADEWWEEREEIADAERMTGAIVEEIRGNRQELLDPDEPDPANAIMADLDSAIALLRDGREPDGLSVTWDVALLSSAAWEAAQVSRATQHMELDLLIDLAQIYEFQRMYAETQDDLVSLISDLPAGMESAPLQTLLSVRSRFAVASNLRSTLATIYACRLSDMEGPDAAEAEDCPSEG